VKNPIKFVAAALMLALAGVLVNSTLVDAQDAASGQYKIGVVDRKQVFEAYNKYKSERQQLESDMATMQSELDAIADNVEALREQYRATRDTMTEEQRKDKEQEIERKSLDWRSKYDTFQRQMDLDFRDLVSEAKTDINGAIEQIAREENYHLVLEGDPKAASGVIYYVSAIDMTPKVIARVNQ
jgi:Skp family chaperone for outer membrane proteins